MLGNNFGNQVSTWKRNTEWMLIDLWKKKPTISNDSDSMRMYEEMSIEFRKCGINKSPQEIQTKIDEFRMKYQTIKALRYSAHKCKTMWELFGAVDDIVKQRSTVIYDISNSISSENYETNSIITSVQDSAEQQPTVIHDISNSLKNDETSYVIRSDGQWTEGSEFESVNQPYVENPSEDFSFKWQGSDEETVLAMWACNPTVGITREDQPIREIMCKEFMKFRSNCSVNYCSRKIIKFKTKYRSEKRRQQHCSAYVSEWPMNEVNEIFGAFETQISENGKIVHDPDLAIMWSKYHRCYWTEVGERFFMELWLKYRSYGEFMSQRIALELQKRGMQVNALNIDSKIKEFQVKYRWVTNKIKEGGYEPVWKFYDKVKQIMDELNKPNNIPEITECKSPQVWVEKCEPSGFIWTDEYENFLNQLKCKMKKSVDRSQLPAQLSLEFYKYGIEVSPHEIESKLGEFNDLTTESDDDEPIVTNDEDHEVATNVEEFFEIHELPEPQAPVEVLKAVSPQSVIHAPPVHKQLKKSKESRSESKLSRHLGLIRREMRSLRKEMQRNERRQISLAEQNANAISEIKNALLTFLNSRKT